jgi:nitroreductase
VSAPDAGTPGLAGTSIFEVMHTCRAMRYLKSTPVPDELVKTLIWAATRAPSPSNSQTWHFIVVDDRELIAQIGTEVATVMAQRAAGRAPTNDESLERVFRGGYHLAQTLVDVPLLVIVAATASYPPSAPDEKYVWSTVYPAAQNLLLAARALGLGATFTTLHHFAPETFYQHLRIPPEVYIGSVIPVGWPDRPFGPVRRRPIEEVLHRNGWQHPPKPLEP